MASAEPATLDVESTDENPDMGALDADERRALRARTENMIVVPQTDTDGRCIGMYEVFSQSGSQYTVDLDRPHGCTCPDTEYRNARNCKHRRRVALEISFAGCPAPDQPVGDYEGRLADLRESLERRREAVREDLEVIEGLLAPFSR